MHSQLDSELDLLCDDDASERITFASAPLITHEAIHVLGEDISRCLSLYGSALDPLVQGEEDGFSNVKNRTALFSNSNVPFHALVSGLPTFGREMTLAALVENALTVEPRQGQRTRSVLALRVEPSTGLAIGPSSLASLFGNDDARTPDGKAPTASIHVLPASLTYMQRTYANHPDVEVRALQFQAQDLTGERLMRYFRPNGCHGAFSPAVQCLNAFLYSLKEYDYEALALTIEALPSESAESAQMRCRLALLRECTASSSTKPTPEATVSNGSLTIVHLASPFLDTDSVMALLELVAVVYMSCVSITHKVLVLENIYASADGVDNTTFTETVQSIMRDSTRYGTSVYIAQAELPAVPARLMPHISAVFLHRISSPSWFKYLMQHVPVNSHERDAIFRKLIGLTDREAILLAPTAAIVGNGDLGQDGSTTNVTRLGMGHLVVRPRTSSTPIANIYASHERQAIAAFAGLSSPPLTVDSDSLADSSADSTPPILAQENQRQRFIPETHATTISVQIADENRLDVDGPVLVLGTSGRRETRSSASEAPQPADSKIWTAQYRFLPLVSLLDKEELRRGTSIPWSILDDHLASLPCSPLRPAEDVTAYIKSAIDEGILEAGIRSEPPALRWAKYGHLVFILQLLHAEGDFHPKRVDVEARGRSLFPDTWDSRMTLRRLMDARRESVVEWDLYAGRMRLATPIAGTVDGQDTQAVSRVDLDDLKSTPTRKSLGTESPRISSPLNPTAPAFRLANDARTPEHTAGMAQGFPGSRISADSEPYLTSLTTRTPENVRNASEPRYIALYSPLIDFFKLKRLAGVRRVTLRQLADHLNGLSNPPHTTMGLLRYISGAVSLSLIAVKGPDHDSYVVLHNMGPLIWVLLGLRAEGIRQPSPEKVIARGIELAFPGTIAFRYFESYLQAAIHMGLVRLHDKRLELVADEVDSDVLEDLDRTDALSIALAKTVDPEADGDEDDQSDTTQVSIIRTVDVGEAATISSVARVVPPVTLHGSEESAISECTSRGLSPLATMFVPSTKAHDGDAVLAAGSETSPAPRKEQRSFQTDAESAWTRFSPLVYLLIQNAAVGKRVTQVRDVLRHLALRIPSFDPTRRDGAYLTDARQLYLIDIQEGQTCMQVTLHHACPLVWTLINFGKEGQERPSVSELAQRGNVRFAGTGMPLIDGNYLQRFGQSGVVEWDVTLGCAGLTNSMQDLLAANAGAAVESRAVLHALLSQEPVAQTMTTPTQAPVPRALTPTEQGVKDKSPGRQEGLGNCSWSPLLPDLGIFQPVARLLAEHHPRRISRSIIEAFFDRLGSRPYPTGKLNKYLSDAAAVRILRMSDPSKDDWVEILPIERFCPLIQILRFDERLLIGLVTRRLVDDYGIQLKKVSGTIKTYESHGLVRTVSDHICLTSRVRL